MKIVCVGGGPAGLYFAISAKLRDPDHEIVVFERNPIGETYGWGVVFWDDLLDNIYANDFESAQEIRASFGRWNEQEVHIQGKETAYLGGYGFSMGRERLLEILARRAIALGADVRFECNVGDVSEFDGADLVVACDGLNSRVRQLHADYFESNVDVGRNKYIWLGTHMVFEAFTFAFEKTEAGWIWFHAYGFDAETSTFIVECSQETWEGLGFDHLGREESLARLETIFERYLDGHSLIHRVRDLGKLPWLNFRRITNEKWHHKNVVLLGDAAHTTHFTIGSGTKLALGDAICLAEQLHEHEGLQDALDAYEEERRTALLELQGEARKSTEWFENIDHHIDQDFLQFAYSLVRRRGKETPPEGKSWRYRLYLATQKVGAVRRVRRWRNSVRRELRARRRAPQLRLSRGTR